MTSGAGAYPRRRVGREVRVVSDAALVADGSGRTLPAKAVASARSGKRVGDLVQQRLSYLLLVVAGGEMARKSDFLGPEVACARPAPSVIEAECPALPGEVLREEFGGDFAYAFEVGHAPSVRDAEARIRRLRRTVAPGEAWRTLWRGCQQEDAEKEQCAASAEGKYEEG